jgi:DNA-directed RNA polymerase specialized sigma24 family protein
MPSEGSVTHWIGRLQAGNEEAARLLWERYFRRLVGLARKRLHASPFRSHEEDVALSAFASFCRGARESRFPRLADRKNLWGLLITITSRKALDLLEHEGRPIRYPGPTDPHVENLLGQEPDPAFAAQVAEDLQHLLDRLHEPGLQEIALWKLEGYTNEEIAAKLSLVHPTHERSVERKLAVIRQRWTEETGE